MWSTNEVDSSPIEQEDRSEKNALRISRLHVAICEMDEAQRLRLDQINERLKHISAMSDWCAAAALIYIIATAITFFR